MSWDDTKIDDDGASAAGRLLATEYNALVTAVKARLLKSMYNANTIITADTEDTPAALEIAEQTLVGRITGGLITTLTPAQIRTLIGTLDEDNMVSDSDTALATQQSIKKYVDDSVVGTVNIFLAAESAYLPQSDFSLSGTVTMTNGSTAVTGSGTAFDTELQVNDYIKLDADNSASWAKVASIESATGLTLSAVYGGTGGASAGSGSGNPVDLGEVIGDGRYMGWSALKFDDTLTNPDGGERVGWRIPMPDYDGGNIVLTGIMKPATTPVGAVTCILNIRTIGLATSEAFDKAITADTGVNMSFSLNTTELSTDAVFATATIDPVNVVAEDLMVIEVDRDVADTLSGDGQLLCIMMQYERT